MLIKFNYKFNVFLITIIHLIAILLYFVIIKNTLGSIKMDYGLCHRWCSMLYYICCLLLLLIRFFFCLFCYWYNDNDNDDGDKDEKRFCYDDSFISLSILVVRLSGYWSDRGSKNLTKNRFSSWSLSLNHWWRQCIEIRFWTRITIYTFFQMMMVIIITIKSINRN